MLGRGPLAFGPLAALTGFPGLASTLAATFDELTLAGIGKVTVKGTLGVTLDAVLLAGVGKVPAQGTLVATFGALTLAAAGNIPSRGTLAATLGPVTLAATANLPAQGTLGATLGALTLAGASKALIQGQFPAQWTFGSLLGHGPLASAPLASLTTTTASLDAMVLAGTGTVANYVYTATLAATLGPATLSATGKLPVQGTLGATLGALTLAGSGAVTSPARTAALAATLGALTLAGAGSISSVRTGTLAVTLGALTGTFTGKVTVRGTAAGTLFPLVLVGTGTVANQTSHGTLAVTLGSLALSGAGTVAFRPRTGTANITLGPLTLEGTGHGTAALTAWPHEWCPVPGASHVNTLAVEVVGFGDGYNHRLTRGLNPVRPTMTYAFPFIDVDQLTQMNTFLKTYGAQGFAFQPPDQLDPVTVCSSEWSATIIDRTGHDDDVVGTMQVTFARMFNLQPIQMPL